MLAADLINELPRADCRPANACERINAPGGPAIRVTSPSRLTWTMRLPHRGHFESTLTTVSDAPVRLRVGVADDRTYEQLAQIALTKTDGPTPLDIDLGAYAGRKWSLFYRPDEIDWRLTLSADAIGGTPGTALWEAPRVMTTRQGEAEYQKRTNPR